MSLSLHLLPFTHDGPSLRHAHTMLSVDASAKALELAIAQEGLVERPVVQPFHSYVSRNRNGAIVYGEIRVTPYGKPLGYLLAGELLLFRAEPYIVYEPACRAAWAYLAQLDPETKVALYWH